MALKLYVAALYAMNPDSDAPEVLEEIATGKYTHVVGMSLSPMWIYAHTDAEAEDLAHERLFEWRPPEEGWENHGVRLKQVPREWIAAALEKTAEEAAESGDDDSSALVM